MSHFSPALEGRDDSNFFLSGQFCVLYLVRKWISGIDLEPACTTLSAYSVFGAEGHTDLFHRCVCDIPREGKDADLHVFRRTFDLRLCGVDYCTLPLLSLTRPLERNFDECVASGNLCGSFVVISIAEYQVAQSPHCCGMA